MRDYMIGNATRHRTLNESLISALAVAGFFIILGFVIVLTPDISQKTDAFFRDLTTVTYNLGNSSTISLLAPAHPAQHIAFFNVLLEFFLAIGILQILVLAVRLWVRSPTRRITETIGNLVFWSGAAVVVNYFLLAGTTNGWFEFWEGLVFVFGASLVIRFSIYLTIKRSKK